MGSTNHRSHWTPYIKLVYYALDIDSRFVCHVLLKDVAHHSLISSTHSINSPLQAGEKIDQFAVTIMYLYILNVHHLEV